MTQPSRPARHSRRRIWLTAGSVCGIVAVTAAVGAVQLNGGSGSGAGGRTARPAGLAEEAAAQAANPGSTAVAGSITLPKAKWKISWHDEFNGRGAAAASRWVPVVGNGTKGWSHHALNYYQPGNVRQDGKGNLIITAAKTPASTPLRCWNGRCKYTSGRIQTKGKFGQGYGRFAVRAKLPTGKGIWPAFWMQAVRGKYAEIDVVETIGSKPSLVQGWAHDNGRRRGGGARGIGKPLSAAYHVYGVDWTPHRVVWWVDGKPYAQMKRYKNWGFYNRPFYLILNIQVGGDWPGSPNKATRFPARMAVDWVRVYKATS